MSKSITNPKNKNGLLMMILGWLIPGAGQVCMGYLTRGVFLGVPIWVLFLLGIKLGGHLHGLGDANSSLLTYVFGLCDFGMGLFYMLAKFMGWAQLEQGWRSTAEYANIFLMVAGLLNYLVALDALDLSRGTKI